MKTDASTSGTLTERISSLKSRYPSGKYWNHAKGTANNPDSYTSTPCTHHDSEKKYCSSKGYNGWCGCNSFNGTSIQC